jgi:XisH protein
MLKELEIEMPLYLSVPEIIFNDVFDVIVQRAISESQIKLIIVNLDEERVVRWSE